MNGDPASITAFVVRMKCVPRMLASLNRKLMKPLDDHELADLSQEVLVVAWRRMRKFEGKSSLDAWVYRICFNLIMNALRKKQRSYEASFPDERSNPPEPEARWRDPHEFEDVYAGLERIPDAESQVVRLKHFAGLTFDEVGTQLDIPSNTAKTRYYRGIASLQAHFRVHSTEESA